jgi:hypothetical protein
VAVAVNCWVTPPGMLGLAGVTNMEERVAEFTVRVVLPEIVPEVAVMVAVPAARAVTKPLLLMVATDVFDELQVTWVAILKLVPSEYVPVAVNCWVTPAGMLGLAGVRDMEDRTADVTLRIVLAEEPELEKLLGVVETAVIIVVPGEMAVARPPLSIVATDVFDELQVTSVFILRLVWSLK